MIFKMRPSTKILFGAWIIVASISFQFLSMFGALKALGKLVGRDIESLCFSLQLFVLPFVSLIGFIFTLIGMYQAAKLAEKAISLSASIPQSQSSKSNCADQ